MATSVNQKHPYSRRDKVLTSGSTSRHAPKHGHDQSPYGQKHGQRGGEDADEPAPSRLAPERVAGVLHADDGLWRGRRRVGVEHALRVGRVAEGLSSVSRGGVEIYRVVPPGGYVWRHGGVECGRVGKDLPSWLGREEEEEEE